MAYEAYWVKRADARMADIHTGSGQTILEIKEAYEEAISQLDKDIDRLFYRYAGNNGLTAEGAKELLNERLTSVEVKKIRAAIDDISDPDIKENLMAKLNATVSRARITRLEALKEDIYIQMSRMADVELAKSTSRYIGILEEEYLHNVFDCQQYLGYAYSFSRIPAGTVQEILKNDWSGKHYSKRIWDNAMATGGRIEDTVRKLLLKGTLTGANSRRLAAELDKLANAGMYACERLIRTESTYFTAMADLEAARARGTRKLKFVATLDQRTSPQCREADGSIINIEDAVPGKNIPPLHPYCRSVVIDVVEGLVHKVRRARDPVTGKNYLVPADMAYKEWKETLVDSGKLSAGNEEENTETMEHDPPKTLEHIDYSDKDVVSSTLQKYEAQIADSPVENAVVVTKDGDVIQCYGDLNHVYPNVDLGEQLTGASVTHNHPVGSDNEYSFSNDDISLFMDNDLEVLRGIDEKYIYELTRNADIIDESIPLKDLMTMEDRDEYGRHVFVIEEARERGIGYRRWKRDG